MRTPILLSIVAATASARAQQPSFTVIQPPVGYETCRYPVISGDAQTVFFRTYDPNIALGGGRSFRWVRGSPAPHLIPGPAGSDDVEIVGSSVDGTAAVGRLNFYGHMRWTLAGGSTFDPGQGIMRAASRDVAATAGGIYYEGLESNMYLYRQGQGVVHIPPPSNLPPEVYTTAISGDGNVAFGVVGWSQAHFRWTPGAGYQYLPQNLGRPRCASFDGSVVAGWGGLRSSPRTAVEVGDISCEDMTPDGWVMVGDNFDGSGIWDPIHGERDLEAVLASHGVASFQGWSSLRTYSVSDDGSTVVGDGRAPDGQRLSWVAVIPRFCYANCDGTTTPPTLNVADFTCFLQRFAAGDEYANCDTNAQLNVADFTCFIQRFASGCTVGE